MKLIILLLLPIIVCAQGIDDLRWKKRVVMIYGPSFDTEEVTTQVALLRAESTILKEYKLTIITVTNSGTRRDGGKIYPNSLKTPIETFSVQLIGLDGGVKLENAAPVESQQIFDLIDTMPMRRREKGNK